MAKTIISVVNDVLNRLGDTAEKVWDGPEIKSYLKEGYDRMARDAEPFWDQAYLEDKLTTANVTADWEAAYLSGGELYTGTFRYTCVEERDWLESPAEINFGPTTHNHLWEVAYLDSDQIYYQAVHTLPTNVYQIDRSTWNYMKIEPLRSTELEMSDRLYETANGEVMGYVMDKDGLQSFRKWRVPSAAADATTVWGNFGIAKNGLTGIADPNTTDSLMPYSVDYGSGTLAAGVYFWKFTYYNSAGETKVTPSAIAAAINGTLLSSQGTLTIQPPTADADAAGWKLYVTVSSIFRLQATVEGFTTAAVLSTPVDAAGSTIPTANTTGIAAVTGTRGIPRRIPTMHPTGDTGGFGLPRRPFLDLHNTRIEFSRRGRAVSADGDTFELPDHYVKYLRHFALWKALARRGAGQDMDYAEHWRLRYEMGLARMKRRATAIHSNERMVISDGKMVSRGRPPLARLPWQYGRVVGYPRL